LKQQPLTAPKLKWLFYLNIKFCFLIQLFLIFDVQRFGYATFAKPENVRTIPDMKKLLIIVIFGQLMCFGPGATEDRAISRFQDKSIFKEGDIIFQTSQSAQSKAIQLATKSKYCHCGIIFKKGPDLFVFEASQTVKFTPIDKWVSSGLGGKYVIRRLKDADEVLKPQVIQKMKSVNDQLKGKAYDRTFEWTDDKIYCSELVWKIYKRGADIEVGKLQKLKEFDLSSETVRTIMKERYGNKIPYDEVVVSPASIFDSNLLVTVQTDH
jgi:hypothetical protein